MMNQTTNDRDVVILRRLRTRYPGDRDVLATDDRDVALRLRHDEEWHCPDCADGAVLWSENGSVPGAVTCRDCGSEFAWSGTPAGG